MTYEEIKKRLSKCEKTLEALKSRDLSTATAADRQEVQRKFKVLNESIVKYNALLTEADQGIIYTDDEKKAKDLADDGANVKLTKEQEGITFSVEETKAIAKKVGKALAMALKAVGEAVTSMKAHNLEENSFEIKILYKNGSDDEFSFYISKDTLHLQDFSFDKELVDVGVKPSGEAIVNVDVLSNELQKHFKSLKENLEEVNYNHYTEPKHFDICPGAEALRDEVIEGGKSPEELGEWTFKHDELFKLEKAVLKAKKADERHVKVANQLRDEIIHLSRDLGIEAGKINYLKGHVKKIEDVANGVVKEGEGDDHHYIKVPRPEFKAAERLIATNIDGNHVKMDYVDDDGMGNVVIYFMFKSDAIISGEADSFMYDVVMDLQAHGIDVQDHSAELDENVTQKHIDDIEASGNIDIAYKKAMELLKSMIAKNEALDHNDPVLMKMRAAKMKRDRFAGSDPKAGSTIKSTGFDPIILKLKAKRAQIMRDMEQEAEPEGGPIADKYGDMLNKIDAAIAKARGQKTMTYHQAIAEDEEETDYVKRRREEDDYYEDPDYYKEDVDVGHQDDEPSMLKNTAYESATYAAKLYKKLAKYDQHDGEVDFPNWWQSKLILAKDYLSKAFHYLDSEEKQPMLDKLALEEGVNEGTELYDRNGINIKRFSGGKKGVMVQITYGMDYIQVPADEFPILARAMQSVIGDLKDMNRQVPRSKNVGEALDSDLPKGKHSIAKLQKVHGMIVDKMKELAKLYKEKGGDHEYNGHPVIDHLKSLTTKKKKVEAALDKAVSNKGKNQELTEVTEDQVQDAIQELRDLIDEIEAKGEEAREVVRQVFPNELSRLDAYGAFSNMYSANRYDVTLGGFVDRLEEEGFEIEDGEVYTNEGDYKSDAQRKAIYAAKAEKEKKNEALQLVHVYDKDGKMYGTGSVEKVEGDKTTVRFDGSTVKRFPSDRVKPVKEAAPGFKHDCAAKVIHKEHGAGTCIPEKHTLVKEGNKYVVTHYDVLFESGKTVEDIPVSELEIKTQKEHWHKGYKKKKK